MTLYQFKLLSVHVQAQTTWDHGVFLGFRQAGVYHMVLYKTFDFYVEVQYHTAQNQISGIKSFISLEPLQPYLNKIDISGLINPQ